MQKPLCAFHTFTVVSLDADITNTHTDTPAAFTTVTALLTMSGQVSNALPYAVNQISTTSELLSLTYLLAMCVTDTNVGWTMKQIKLKLHLFQSAVDLLNNKSTTN